MDRALINVIINLIKTIDEINAEAIDVLNGRTNRNMDDLRYSLGYIYEYVEELEDIKEVVGLINYGLEMAMPEPYLNSLRDELECKYEKMYEPFYKVHYMVFKR